MDLKTQIDQAASLAVPRWVVAVFGGAFLLVLMRWALLETQPTAPVQQEKKVQLRAGPWGELESVKIWIEKPDEFVAGNYATNAQSHWFFPNMTSAQLLALFQTCGLTRSQAEWLCQTNRWITTTNGIEVPPTGELVLELPRSARQQIYSALAEWPRNQYQYSPFTVRADEASDWLEQSGLSKEMLALLERLLYQRGNTICFSDLDPVYGRLTLPGEKRRLLKTLSRQSTVLMQLVIRPRSDVEALVGYWGKGGRAKDVRPLLESLTRVPGRGTIDIVHLVPPLARRLLYTYPYPSNDPVELQRNCLWSAMNFFNEEPDDRFCDIREVEKAIRSDYYPIQNEPTFGDVFFLVDSSGQPFHAGVFIAEEKVFTKNGAHYTRPWLIMDFQDLMACFPSNKPIRISGFRLKRL